MKRLYVLISGIALIVLSFFLSKFTLNVNAATMGFTYPSGIYFERTGSHYVSNAVPFYTVDGKITYCVEPGVEVTTYSYHSVTFNNANLPYDINKLKEVELIGYYGYEYPGHQTNRYRVATQALIWEHTSSDPVRFTTERYGEGSEVNLDYEKNEIMKLVNSHYTKPSFNGTSKSATLGQEFYVEDSSGVLSNFEVQNDGGNTARISGNKLYITPKTIGSSSITLVKKHYDNGTTLLWRGDDGSQVLGALRASDPVKAIVNLNTVGAKVTIEKVDSKSKQATPQGDGSLQNAVYGLYDEYDVLVTKLTTDANGRATTDYLSKIGNFKIKEITPSKGYQLDKTVYNIEITADSTNPKVKVYEDVIERKLQIFKAFATDKTGFLTGEPNISFEIYLKSSNKLVATITTNSSGYAETTLPYGTYVVKQKNVTAGYEKAKDFEIVINGDTQSVLHKTLANAEITAKLKLVKIDSESKLPIKLAGVQFKIKDANTNKYVCQTISYPNQKEVCTFETDANGVFMTPYPLSKGTYKIEEVKAPKGYLLNSNTISFTIDGNANLVEDSQYGKYIKVEFTNKQIKGEIKVEKSGEAFNYGNGSFSYGEKKLEGIEISLYAASDITTADGVLHYHKGDLIKSVKTDSNGKITFSNLYLGNYIVKETKTLNDYILDSTEHSVTLTSSDNTTAIVSKTLQLKNNLKKGDLDFTKTDLTTGDPLPNALIEIYNSNNELIYRAKSNDAGKIVVKNLKVGKYYILEKEAPEGYVLSKEKISFEILNNGQVIKANMKNKPIIGDLDFTKEDISDGTPLPNTLIEVYKKDTDELIFSGRTDENGKIKIEGLRYGKYYILEKEAPEGYVLNEGKMYFEILMDGEVIKATMTDEKIKGDLDFTKEDISDGTPLPNTLIEVYKKDTDELIFSGRTDETGKIVIKDIEYGEYYILEKEAPEGYVLNEEKMFFEIKINGEVVKATMKDEKIKGDLKFTKEDLSTGEPLPNTLIEIYKQDTDELIFSGRTDETGQILIKDIEYGKYYILEKEAPEGYVLNEGKMYFEILMDGEVIKATMTDEKIKGDLDFTKEDISDGTPLPNTLIEVYKKDTDELIFSGRTDETGKIVIKDIEYGEYYILEKEAPEGYVLNEEKMFFEIKINGEVVKATMKDEKIRGDLEFTKEDFSTEEPLPNTLIEVYKKDTDELIFSGRTDETGKIVIKDLEYGEYYILEKEAPEGYVLNEEKMFFEIKTNGEIVKSTMKNQKIKSKIHIHKVDVEDNPLAGVVIGLYDKEGNLLDSFVTDKEGNIDIELEYGSYYFEELVALEGYQLSEEKVYVDVVKDGDTFNINLINELEEIKVPITSANSNIDLIAGIIALIGFGIVAIAIIKNKRK